VGEDLQLRLYPQAAEDLRAIYDPLYSEIVAKLRMLRRYPELGQALPGPYKGWRTAPVRIFRIIYRVTPQAVEVLFIRHCKRDLPKPPQ